MQTTEVYAAIGALSQGLLGLMFVLVWRRQRESWAALFATGYLLAALLYASEPYTLPVAGKTNLPAALLSVPALLAWTLGFVRYVGLPPAIARRVDTLATVTAALLLSALVARLLGRLPTFFALAAFLAGQALMALWAMRREPGHGHGLVFAALLLYPMVVAMAALGWFELHWLRYVVIAPLGVSGVTVLTTGLLRAQRRAAQELQRRERAEAALQALNDTLEQRVGERTAQLNDMVAGLESFNRSVSHDLRGPLGGMAGVSRLGSEALARNDSATAQRMFAAITVQADTLGQLVNDLLLLARVGDAALAPQPVDLQALVRDTLEQLHRAEPGKQPPVELHALPMAEADPGLLRQVFVNLLGNAIKFSQHAQAPHIEVGAFARDGEQVFFVRDNGVGFDADQAEHLFQPFSRLHGARYPGHGVGLSIVKRIVERHGGRLWVQAKPDAGATFFFSLPAAGAARSAH